MSRVRVGDELARLADFQRATVDHVFRSMYLDSPAQERFLVADEVGLGKTLVARGLIARTIAHLKEQNVPRIDIVYVCSNASIAQQNMRRINVLGEQETAFATRLTLLPARVKDLSKNRVNFISFTPAVALNVKSKAGTKEERAVLYRLLEGWPAPSTTAMANLLQHNAKRTSFDRAIEDVEDVNAPLRDAFLTALRNEPVLCADLTACLALFARYREVPDAQDHARRTELIGALRNLLAHACIHALEPDLVILDEFQRFSDILHGDPEDETVSLARRLFEFKDVRVLLLSATPYKMLSLAGEEPDRDHFRDFLETTRFLFRDEAKVERLQGALRGMRDALHGLGTKQFADALAASREVTALLSSVMTRMERVDQSSARDSLMIEPTVETSVEREDIGQALLAERASRLLGAGDAIEYWKSAPYLLSFMREYELADRVREASRKESKELAALLSKHEQDLLPVKEIANYGQVPMANGRMRALARDTIERGLWKLLWMPPALPYVEAKGAWAEARGATKALVFSGWNVVPDAVAGLLSYEAERRMVAARGAARYEEDARPLLSFRLDDKRPAAMTTAILLYPCALFAEHLDPLRLSLELGGGAPVALDDLRAEAARKLKPLLATLACVSEAPVDPRWYWAAPVLLDRRYQAVDGWLRGQFPETFVDDADEDPSDDEHQVSDVGFRAHVDLLRAARDGKLDLGAFPEDLATVLADMALASPAVCAVRALRRIAPELAVDEPVLLTGAAKVARGFRSLFNLRETTALLRGADEDAEAYWRAVLSYCAEGDLQAVLDEYTHYVRGGLSPAGDAEKRVDEAAAEMSAAVSLRVGALTARDVRAIEGRVTFGDVHLRTRFAARLSEVKDEKSNSVARAEDVRRAFNSPFRPFVLASTSVGQEGLDFHPYCHAVVHWNLPRNPVDLEQREGRVHRHKGHAIRKNVAQAYGLSKLADHWDQGDPWARLFEMAALDRPAGANDLWPCWLFDTPNGARVERRIPMLPLSREHAQLQVLKKNLALYRLTFGQPRQDDLLSWLRTQSDGGALTSEQVEDLRIVLRASGALLPVNEDPDPEDVDADMVVPSLPAGSVEAALRAWARTAAGLSAVVRLFVAALDAVPNAATSPHWTVNRWRKCLRLILGLPAVLTFEDTGVVTAVVSGMSAAELSAFSEDGIVVRKLPYERLQRLAPRAKWVEVPVDVLPAHVDVIARGLQNFVQLDTRESASPQRKYLALDAVQALGRLAGAARWADWKPG